MISQPILKAQNIHKEFRQGTQVLHVLKGLDFEIQQGEAICIVGPSGAGKSTFLHILGALEGSTQGSVFYKTQNLSRSNDKQRALFRRQKVGFVFQFHYLLSEFKMIENIMIAGQIGGMKAQETKIRAQYLMELLGISHRQDHFPNTMSGGERQRAAIARAMMNQPEILLVDEPTGTLDKKNSIKVLDILFEMKECLSLTLVAVSHDSLFSKPFPKILTMEDGQWLSR